jgi:hypothetical protein
MINDWKDGALMAGAGLGCVIHARLNIPSAGATHASGDGEFMSSDAMVKADKPYLEEFGLGFVD